MSSRSTEFGPLKRCLCNTLVLQYTSRCCNLFPPSCKATLQDYNVRNGDVVIQIKDTELLASADSQLSQLAQEQQSKLDNIQLVFPPDLRICRVCRVPAYFQRGWCFNINCECKGNATTALSQQWLCEKQQQTQQSHPHTPQLVLPPCGIRQCAMCRQWTYLRKGWCCNANCCRKH